MGTWGTNPFDSDLAADFVDGLAGMSAAQVVEAMTRAVVKVAEAGSRVDGGDGAEAVAASALLASRIPGSQVVIGPDDGPSGQLPDIPLSLRPVAVRALRRVLQDGSELAVGWVDGADAEEWRATIRRIIRVLDATP
ncbi:DUF4259 domain-containing protein [Streptomyces sp. NPDC048331]|uniref:DUF4259 domain-containing protein n=1 Tax=Streptomyces sp. NPDC048331 TaxID=3365534 RepID=UPI003716A57A